MITASELLAELAACPDAADRERRSREHSRRANTRYVTAARPVLAALAAVGVEVDSLAGVGTHENRASALPVLTEWALRSDYDALRTTIVWTIGERWTGRRGVEALFELYETPDAPDGVRWCAAGALERRVGAHDLERVIGHARDDDGTSDRVLLVLALGRFTKARDRVLPVLVELLDQLDARAAAIQALGRLHAVEYRDLIAPYAHDADGFVREKVRGALRIIDRASRNDQSDKGGTGHEAQLACLAGEYRLAEAGRWQLRAIAATRLVAGGGGACPRSGDRDGAAPSLALIDATHHPDRQCGNNGERG